MDILYYATASLIAFSFLVMAAYVLFPAFYRKGRRRAEKISGNLPKVSVLKPVKNSDDELEKNLESFYTMEYPDFEMVFGVETGDDSCLPVIELVSRKYPGITTKIVRTAPGGAINPKIESLAAMAQKSEGSLFWVTDANVRVERDTLRSLAGEWMRGAKIVYSPIRGIGSSTLASIMENANMNFFVSGNIIAALKYFNRVIIVGKSMLIDRAALEAMGGFLRFGEYLAEDFIMGELFLKGGHAVSTNFTWVTSFNSTSTIKSFCARLSRWAKLRYHIDKLFYLSEMLVNPICLSLLALLYLGERGIPLLLAAAGLKVLFEYANFLFVNNEDRKKWQVHAVYPFAVVIKDIFIFAINLTPFFTSSVNWRGREIRIGADSRICPQAGYRRASQLQKE